MSNDDVDIWGKEIETATIPVDNQPMKVVVAMFDQPKEAAALCKKLDGLGIEYHTYQSGYHALYRVEFAWSLAEIRTWPEIKIYSYKV